MSAQERKNWSIIVIVMQVALILMGVSLAHVTVDTQEMEQTAQVQLSYLY